MGGTSRICCILCFGIALFIEKCILWCLCWMQCTVIFGQMRMSQVFPFELSLWSLPLCDVLWLDFGLCVWTSASCCVQASRWMMHVNESKCHDCWAASDFFCCVSFCFCLSCLLLLLKQHQFQLSNFWRNTGGESDNDSFIPLNLEFGGTGHHVLDLWLMFPSKISIHSSTTSFGGMRFCWWEIQTKFHWCVQGRLWRNSGSCWEWLNVLSVVKCIQDGLWKRTSPFRAVRICILVAVESLWSN